MVFQKALKIGPDPLLSFLRKIIFDTLVSQFNVFISLFLVRNPIGFSLMPYKIIFGSRSCHNIFC